MATLGLDAVLPPVGRDFEEKSVASLIDDACAGSGDALVVRGEPGIGKTTLLAQARRLGRDRAMRILVCSGVEAESNLPFAGLHQLLRPVMNALPRVSAHQARILRAAFGTQESISSDFYQIALATLELLAAAAATTPLLIVADDAHWTDRPSTDVLAFLGRRVAAEPIAMVIAVREGTDDPFVGHDLHQLLLAPLDGPASASLLDRVAPGLAQDLRERILLGAAGNPLALTELPTIAGEWPVPADRMPVGELLEKSFATRTAELPETTRTLLLAAAAAGGVSSSLAEQCAAATEVLGREIGARDLQPAVDARLVKLSDGQVVFCHPLMASAIYQSATIGERLETHTALAGVVADDDRRVWHRAAAALGHDDDVAADLELVADRAARRGAVSVSVAALDRASSLTSNPTRRADTLLRASEYAVELGRRGLAIDLAGRADRGRLSPLGEARMMIVEDLVNPWQAEEALTITAFIRGARAARAAGDLDLAVTLLWTAAKRCYWVAAPAVDRAAIDAAVLDLSLPADDPRRIAILSYTGSGHHRTGLERDLPPIGTGHDDLLNLRYLGSAAMNLGDDRIAAALLADAVTKARRQGRLGSIPRLQSLRAWSMLWSGTLDSVTVAAGEAQRLAVELDQPMWHSAAVLELAVATGLRGDYVTAKEQVTAGLCRDDIQGVRLFHAMALYGLGVAALGVGEYQDAYDCFRRILDRSDHASHYAARQWVAGDLVEAAQRTGRLADCAGLIDELDQEWRSDPTTAVQCGTAYADALLAPDAEAPQRFEHAFAVAAGRGRLPLGRAKLAHGSWLRRRRRAREARIALGEALELLDSVGMGGFAGRAARELRAAGGVDNRRPGGSVPELTPQELQIAQLAATGLSNRQIAERLYVSHRTVGSHLYHMYPKLGVTSRGELTDALRAIDR